MDQALTADNLARTIENIVERSPNVQPLLQFVCVLREQISRSYELVVCRAIHKKCIKTLDFMLEARPFTSHRYIAVGLDALLELGRCGTPEMLKHPLFEDAVREEEFLDKILEGACETGNQAVCEDVLRRGALIKPKHMSIAGQHGQTGLIRLFYEKYHYDNVDPAVVASAYAGNKDVMIHLIETYGTTAYTSAAEACAISGMVDGITYLNKHYESIPLHNMLKWAIISGNYESLKFIVHYCVWGNEISEDLLLLAAAQRDERILRFLLQETGNTSRKLIEKLIDAASVTGNFTVALALHNDLRLLA